MNYSKTVCYKHPTYIIHRTSTVHKDSKSDLIIVKVRFFLTIQVSPDLCNSCALRSHYAT